MRDPSARSGGDRLGVFRGRFRCGGIAPSLRVALIARSSRCYNLNQLYLGSKSWSKCIQRTRSVAVAQLGDRRIKRNTRH